MRSRFPSNWDQDTLFDIQLAVKQVLNDTRIKHKYRITAIVESTGAFEAVEELRADPHSYITECREIDPELKSGSE